MKKFDQQIFRKIFNEITEWLQVTSNYNLHFINTEQPWFISSDKSYNIYYNTSRSLDYGVDFFTVNFVRKTIQALLQKIYNDNDIRLFLNIYSEHQMAKANAEFDLLTFIYLENFLNWKIDRFYSAKYNDRKIFSIKDIKPYQLNGLISSVVAIEQYSVHKKNQIIEFKANTIHLDNTIHFLTDKNVSGTIFLENETKFKLHRLYWNNFQSILEYGELRKGISKDILLKISA